MATHSSVLAWRILGKGEPGGLPSMGSHKVGHDCSDLAAAFATEHQQQWSIVHMYHMLFIHSSVFGCLGYFHILATIK